jgi:hypothetical protein
MSFNFTEIRLPLLTDSCPAVPASPPRSIGGKINFQITPAFGFEKKHLGDIVLPKPFEKLSRLRVRVRVCSRSPGGGEGEGVSLTQNLASNGGQNRVLKPVAIKILPAKESHKSKNEAR